MKKFLFGLFVITFLSTVGIGTAHADANDFVIRDFQADYYLNKDSEGRSTLKTVELITAEFPDFDQNHGIERAIPNLYDKHLTSLKVQSVTDQNGTNLSYETSNDNGNSVLRIGNADKYVHGINTYKITYTQRDVTRFFTDTGVDEFYWDTNGNGWSQNFDNVSIRIHIDPSIKNDLTGDMACYYGVSGSTNRCYISIQDDIITVEQSDLKAYENVTFAIGFKPNTFSKYVMSPADFIKQNNILISAVLSITLLIAVFIIRLISEGKLFRRKDIIIPEYLPPKDVDIIVAATVYGRERKWLAAMCIDLAVNHKVKVIEIGKKSYALELLSTAKLTGAERSVMSILFGSDLRIGDRYTTDSAKGNNKLTMDLYSTYMSIRRDAFEKDYITYRNKAKPAMFICLLLIVIGVAIIGMLSDDMGACFAIGWIPILLSLILATTTKVLTKKGWILKNYLKGLKLYIKCAEEDRLKMLQSPEGAEKTPIDTNDKEQLIHLYERVLPYAVMMGIEKEWSKVLGSYYEQQSSEPDWYSGTGVFNAAIFSSGISSISSSSGFSSPTNSSSGGSSGGGSSGGGGGGGGGGGW